MPPGGVPKLAHPDILAYEEIRRVIQAASSLGMNKIRLTGGEPLVRKGMVDFIRQLAELPAPLDVRMTTNGLLLADKARDLAAAGLRRVNISLDSLDSRTYEYITGLDVLPQVWRGIQTALDAGFDRIKLNCVAMKGVNDHELERFAQLSREYPLEVRFIEFMPMGQVDFWSRDRFLSAEEIQRRIEGLDRLEAVPREGDEGPARVFRLPGALGTLGFISPVSNHFCGACNRLRLTAEGKIRVCLLSDREVDIKDALRAGAGPEELAGLLRRAAAAKPQNHLLRQAETPRRAMHSIGG
jgi:cyclic pyranopterin phosphate synthase